MVFVFNENTNMIRLKDHQISDDALGAKFVPFDELLGKSDFVIVCCPLNNETKGMFNAEAFAKMKPSSIFINVARGGNSFSSVRCSRLTY